MHDKLALCKSCRGVLERSITALVEVRFESNSEMADKVIGPLLPFAFDSKIKKSRRKMKWEMLSLK